MTVTTNIDNNKVDENNSDITDMIQGKGQNIQMINPVSAITDENQQHIYGINSLKDVHYSSITLDRINGVHETNQGLKITEDSSNNNLSCGNEFEKLISMSSLSTWNNDPAIISKISRFTPEIIDLVLKWGPCQPKSYELPNGIFPRESNRCFHESWYYRKISDGTEHRDWLTYSPSLNKMFCLYCIIFGKHAQKAWVTDGFRQFQNGTIALIAHETTSIHVEASLRVKLRESCMPILPIMVEERKKQVAFNREVVRQLVEITKYLGYHSLSFRGHREQWSNVIKGNFKDLVILLSTHSPEISLHISNLQFKGRKELSFISWNQQNLLISAIAEEICIIIKSEIKFARFFCISIDTTFDVSRREQVTFIVRYINKFGIVCERLMGMKDSAHTTGQALFSLFSEVMESNNLDWKKYLVGQSYDGAASMQGKYNGLQTKVREINPQAVFIWCHAHRLDLIITSAVGSCSTAVDLFGNLEKLFVFISCSKKRNSIYREKQTIRYPNSRIRSIKKVETTRWMSQAFALDTVLKTLEAILDTLEDVKNQEGQVDYRIGAECNGLIHYLESFIFLLTANIFKKVFDYVEPVSRALQTHNIDILTAIDLLKKSEKNINTLRCDTIFKNIYDTVKTTALDLNFEIELKLPTKRQRRVPRQSGEISCDDPIHNPINSYKINTYFVIIDKVLTELKKRFQDNTIDIAKDLALLSAKTIHGMRKKLSVPSDAFSSICENYKEFLNKDDILREYIQFIESNIEITISEKLPDFLHTTNSSFEEESSCEESVEDETDNNLTAIKYSGSLLIMYKFFLLKRLKSVFPNLYQLLQIGVTLPISSASTERSFSKLKIVKTRLRSTMTQNRLEDLLIISCESDISVQTENIVNNFAKRSSVLSKALTL